MTSGVGTDAPHTTGDVWTFLSDFLFSDAD